MKKISNIWFYTLVGSIVFLTLIVIILSYRKPEVPIDVQDYKLQRTVDSLNTVIQNNAIERNKLGLEIDSLNKSIAQIETNIVKKQKEIQSLRKEHEETVNRVNGFTNNDINSYFTTRYSE
jgi:septal ring factor EnvC (AmiA/AmiB activator)